MPKRNPKKPNSNGLISAQPLTAKTSKRPPIIYPERPNPSQLAQRRQPPASTRNPVYSAATAPDGARARRYLNLSTILAMQQCFDEGGIGAIRKVMKESPSTFLKMLVLLVPREMQISQTTDVKQMSDDQISATIAALESIVARRLGDGAKVIEGLASPANPADQSATPPADVGWDVGQSAD